MNEKCYRCGKKIDIIEIICNNCNFHKSRCKYCSYVKHDYCYECYVQITEYTSKG